MRELDDLDLERVAGGKELRDALTRTANSWDATAKDVKQTSRTVDAKVTELAKVLGVK